jgi:hypothetical protein
LGEREPLLNSYNIPINANTGREEEEAGQTDEEEEADNTGTYYHHPERRLSKSLSRSYGATSTTQ